MDWIDLTSAIFTLAAVLFAITLIVVSTYMYRAACIPRDTTPYSLTKVSSSSIKNPPVKVPKLIRSIESYRSNVASEIGEAELSFEKNSQECGQEVPLQFDVIVRAPPPFRASIDDNVITVSCAGKPNVITNTAVAPACAETQSASAETETPKVDGGMMNLSDSQLMPTMMDTEEISTLSKDFFSTSEIEQLRPKFETPAITPIAVNTLIKQRIIEFEEEEHPLPQAVN